ncbi:MAG TPA: DUF881 domain-containing protein [Intrasporangium sp.]|uniref:DUF881 domain-containing protein n=1 Tax=Intrasporangium sp. TaxID=1925024 RepID=UPI002D78DB1E|nr:DUF881 domain-containing protein [Intrasporangium sp.]HET7397692.1 DUF881 domain-containing protein [Intrasporangium sp.]
MSTPPRRPDASMTLLTSMLERPLDPGYQQAADRRRAAGLPAATSTRTAIVLVMVLLTGFLFAVSARSLRPKPTAAAAVKAQLVQRIEALQAQSSASEARLAALGTQVQALEALALRQSSGSGLASQARALAVQAGAVALTGPGLTLTIDDAPGSATGADAGARPDGGFSSGRVTSADLQIVVNGLWAAGAEAISVNGHRLTSTAAIRFAGQAIIVDFRPLARPYVVTVLGDADRVRRVFEPAFAGVYLSQLAQEYKIRVAWASAPSLTVPGDASLRLSVAEPIHGDVGSAPNPSPTGSSTP